MAQGYRSLAEAIAQEIADGARLDGSLLASIRDAARRERVAPATVARAYAELTRAGVIVSSDRRRARVAVGAQAAAQRFLSAGRTLRLAGSDDPALDLLLERTGGLVEPVGARGSLNGLALLARGSADAAALHLRHLSGEYNAPFARALLPGRKPQLMHLWTREQGIIVPPGNPRGIDRVADLTRFPVALRSHAAGTRILLERLLRDAGADPRLLGGPVYASHLEVAMAVASGAVDAGFGLHAAAARLNLDFVPVESEVFAIAFPAGARSRLEVLRELAASEPFRSGLAEAPGYVLDGCGAIESVA